MAKCPYCGSEEYYPLPQKGDDDYFALVSVNSKTNHVDFGNAFLVHAYFCNSCKNITLHREAEMH